MIYCKQIPPEYQDSLLFDDEGMGPDYINVTGNRDYISRTSPPLLTGYIMPWKMGNWPKPWTI